MNRLNEILLLIDGCLGGSQWFPVLLLGTGLFFTIYLKFPQVRFFRHALRILTGKYEKDTMKGDTSHFQALSTALSGTVGTGNIGGVGLAIFIGGPAALFWMWATAFVGMTTKFVECTLSHKYRIVGADGHIAGGPMYYMERRLNMKWLAVIFAVATVICSFGTGNLPQINNIASSMDTTFHIPPWITGAILSALLCLIIVGGIRRIARVTARIVPLMALIYLAGALAVILSNCENILPSLWRIFADAFSGTAAAGGFLGSTFAFALSKGVGRGLFSNEAGQGSAAIAHSAARADEPVSEGMVAILEPFIDTLVICTITGLTILSSGVWTQKFHNEFQWADMEMVNGTYDETNPADALALGSFLRREQQTGITPFSGNLQVTNGVLSPQSHVTLLHARSVAEDVHFERNGHLLTGEVKFVEGRLVDRNVDVRGKSLLHSASLTAEAFKKGFFGDFGQYIVSIGLLLFAFSTAIAWSYYGDRAITYLLGERFVLPYRIVYSLAFFVAALADTTVIWSLAAIGIVVMAVPNLIGILMLHREMKQSVSEYWSLFRTTQPDEAARLHIK